MAVLEAEIGDLSMALGWSRMDILRLPTRLRCFHVGRVRRMMSDRGG